MQKQINKLQLFVTEDCNLRCDYCYIAKRKSDMSWEIAQKAIDVWIESYEENDWMVLEFFGGEPLLKFEMIKKIVEYSNQKIEPKGTRISFKLNTNATILTAEILDFLHKNNHIFIGFSCDGIKESHDAHRKTVTGKGSFEMVIQNLNLIAQNPPHNRKMTLHTVITPENVHYMHQNYLYFSQSPYTVFNYGYNFSHDSNWKKSDFQEYERQLEKILESEKEKLKNGEKCGDQIVLKMIKHLVSPENMYVCQTGRTKGITVDSTGDIFLCHRFESLKRDPKFEAQKSDFYLGNVRDSEKIDWVKWRMQKEKLAKMMRTNIYAECKTCPNIKYCHWIKCVWNNYYINGDFFKLNTNICKTLAHFLRPTLQFYYWLEAENLLNPYLKGFGYIPPEERPVSFVTKKLTPTEPVEN